MADWNAVWDWFVGRQEPTGKRLFVRSIRISDPAVAFVFGPSCTEADRVAFAELLLTLDGDPFKCSRPILPSAPPGLRFATFGRKKAIFQFDPSKDQITMLACE